MPIVINEIEIAVEVTPNNNTNGSAAASGADAFSREAIIRECIEKIMDLINQKNER